MDVELLSQIVGLFGFLLALSALGLNVIQLRWLGRSIRGNTYHFLAQHAFEIQKVLLEHEKIGYLYADDGPDREQDIFDNMLANYIETMWIQRSQELMDADTWRSFEGLLLKYAQRHREVFEIIVVGQNYTPSLRQHAREVLSAIDHQTTEPVDGAGP